MGKGGALELFIAGVVAIGMVTALTMNGRQTSNVIKSGGTAASGLLNTAIKG